MFRLYIETTDGDKHVIESVEKTPIKARADACKFLKSNGLVLHKVTKIKKVSAEKCT